MAEVTLHDVIRGVRKPDVAEHVAETAETAEALGLGPQLERKPAALSGGQRQRVAMGRVAQRRVLGDVGCPYLVLRLGVADADMAGPPHNPRLPIAQTIDLGAAP